MEHTIKVNDMKDCNLSITVEVSSLLRFRLWIASLLFYLAGLILGAEVQINHHAAD